MKERLGRMLTVDPSMALRCLPNNTYSMKRSNPATLRIWWTVETGGDWILPGYSVDSRLDGRLGGLGGLGGLMGLMGSYTGLLEYHPFESLFTEYLSTFHSLASLI